MPIASAARGSKSWVICNENSGSYKEDQMPCQQCGNGKWRWGFGPCQYDSKADCEAAHPGGHHFEDQLAFLDSLETPIERARLLLNDCFFGFDDEEPEQAQTLNMNDVFGWALAWGEYVSDAELLAVADLYKRYGFCGLVYWVSQKHEGMRSEFEDINRFIDFVNHEEALRMECPDDSNRAYKRISYVLGSRDVIHRDAAVSK
jgi:hypothetical protein